MILIDRGQDNNYIYLTLDGLAFGSTLFLKNDALRLEAQIELGVDLSTGVERYNMFYVSTALFAEVPDGYSAYEVRVLSTGEVIESGKLYIIPRPAETVAAANEPTDNVLVIN